MNKSEAEHISNKLVNPHVINVPKRNYIFVFGSNEAGIHGAGAAHDALRHFGAVYGQGIGPQGESYAIPTKDHKLHTLPIATIDTYVACFLAYARFQDHKCFHVTRIGCGLAGYSDYDIAPLFKGASINCILPFGWREINGDTP
jgi:hypothetical protein